MAGNQRYKKVRNLNKGSFGSVILAQDTQEDRLVAIKYLPRSRVTVYVERELMTHRIMWHPHVIKLYEVFLTSTHLAVVMEYAECGDMYDYVSRRGRLKEPKAQWIFQQLMVAVDYVHRMGVANRDIKLENTLLSGNLEQPLVKLCDMGFAKSLDMHSAPKSQVGTPSYFPPEVVSCKQYDGLKADIWSCGVMLFVMLYGTYPFERPGDESLPPAEQQKVLLKRIQEVDYVLRPSVPVSEAAKDMIRRMLVKDPLARITVAQIMEHPFFADGLPDGVKEMNEGLVNNPNVPPRQSEQEILALLAAAQAKAKPNEPLDEYDEYVDAMLGGT